MAVPAISVCVCTFNPRRDVFARALAAIGAQTLARDQFELIVVDNASEPALSPIDLEAAGPVEISLIREEKPGLTRARLAGIGGARGEIIVFVDDDNLLAPEYLANVKAIFESDAKLGVIGGKCIGEFEIEPPGWSRRYLRFLAVGESGEAPIVKYEGARYEAWHPRGAGLAARREAVELYFAQVQRDPARLNMDRTGAQLTGSGDVDLVLTALEQSWGAGYFPQLQLKHVIPKERLEYKYLKKLVRSSMASAGRLGRARNAPMRLRPWPLEYLAAWALCLRDGAFEPKALGLATALARGRYDA